MTNIKYLFFFLFASLIIVGCGDDDEEVIDDTNVIALSIQDPDDGGIVAMGDCGDLHVHVDFAASIENHTVTVVMHPEGDTSDRIIDFEEHNHDRAITFEQDVDLCGYAAGTCFHVEVSACVDHDCVTVERSEAEFCMEQ